jgi:phosphoglycolate phosphatase-like HAD superfamily hydrolase
MVGLILFDIDGTLVRTGGAGEKAFARVCATQFGVPDGTARLSFAGRTDRSIVREFFRLHDIDPVEANFRRFFEAYVFILDELMRASRGEVLPGVRPMLRALRALEPAPVIGLLTGNIRLGAEIKLRHHGLWEEFEMGGFADDAEDRNRIAAVARERGERVAGREFLGEEIVVIGDTPLDVACARAIGARVLAVATGIFTASQLSSHHPDWLVSDLAEFKMEVLLG